MQQKKYNILVIRDLKRLLRIQDYSRAGRCFSLQDQRLLFPFLFLAIHIAVAITIAVPVAVAITIAVAVMVVVGAVEDQRHVREFPLLVHGLDVRKLATVKAAGPHHEERDVGDAVGDRRVRHKTDRDGVCDDDVVAVPQLGEHLIQPLVHQEFGGVRRDGA